MRAGARGASASVENRIGGGAQPLSATISHHKPLFGVGRNELWWGMPKPLPRVSHVESPFVLRAELLTLVPHSMSTIDRLEGEGQFPARIRLEPTNRVAWVRREVTAYLRHLAKRRRSARETHVEAVNEELVARSKQSGPTPEESAR
jgi:predicted DNA-binding transcriptional regulator AlpA